jgi:hypothetical protein
MPQYRCRTHAPLTRPPHSRPDPCSGPRRPRSPAGTPAASSPPGSPHTPGRQRQNIQKGLSHALKPHIPSACRTAQGDRGGTDLIVHNRQEDAAAPIRPPVARPLLRHLGEERPLPSRNQDSINPNGIATKSIRTHASRLGLPYMCLCFGEGGHDGTPHVLPPWSDRHCRMVWGRKSATKSATTEPPCPSRIPNRQTRRDCHPQ